MRHPASEKAEIIGLVERSHLPVRQTLEKLGVPRATCLTQVTSSTRLGGPRRSRSAHPGPAASGAASQRTSAAASSNWP